MVAQAGRDQLQHLLLPFSQLGKYLRGTLLVGASEELDDTAGHQAPYKSKGSGEWSLSTQDLTQVPLLVGFAAAWAAVVFGVVVARGLRTAPQHTARRSLIVANIGVVSIVVFWTGLPVILAAGAATLALDARRRLGRLPGTAIASFWPQSSPWRRLASLTG